MSDITNMGPSGSGNDAQTIGIVIGSICGFLLAVVCFWCCRRERQTRQYQETHPKTRRSTILKIEKSIPKDHDLDALSNVSKAKLKREIEGCLVYKTVITEEEVGKRRSSFMSSLAQSNRVYSSFAAALTRPTQSAKFQDVEMGDENKGASTESPPQERRQSNRLARRLSASLNKSQNDFNNTCFLCLEEYHTGEKVCCSRNEACTHGFHKECIVEWLMTRDVCPLCREDFKNCDKDDTGKGAEDKVAEAVKDQE